MGNVEEVHGIKFHFPKCPIIPFGKMRMRKPCACHGTPKYRVLPMWWSRPGASFCDARLHQEAGLVDWRCWSRKDDMKRDPAQRDDFFWRQESGWGKNFLAPIDRGLLDNFKELWWKKNVGWWIGGIWKRSFCRSCQVTGALKPFSTQQDKGTKGDLKGLKPGVEKWSLAKLVSCAYGLGWCNGWVYFCFVSTFRCFF